MLIIRFLCKTLYIYIFKVWKIHRQHLLQESCLPLNWMHGTWGGLFHLRHRNTAVTAYFSSAKANSSNSLFFNWAINRCFPLHIQWLNATYFCQWEITMWSWLATLWFLRDKTTEWLVSFSSPPALRSQRSTAERGTDRESAVQNHGRLQKPDCYRRECYL